MPESPETFPNAEFACSIGYFFINEMDPSCNNINHTNRMMSGVI